MLVFDEVITGFRVARGGAQERFGVLPDLTILGKIIGGGLPLAAFGGRADVMSALAPSGPVYQAGTLSGNPLATAAGLSVLRRLRDPAVYEELERKGARLEAGLGEHAHVRRVGAMLTAFMTDRGVRNFDDAQAATPIATRSSSVVSCRAASTSRRPSSSRCSSRSRTPTTTSIAPWRQSVSSLQVELWDAIARDAVAESPLWGDALRPPGERRGEAVFSPLAEGRFGLGLETIYEGYLVHYGEPRLFAPADDDSALLLGDYLYAHGLVRVAALREVDAVADLSELISLCSQLRAEGADGDGPLWAARRRCSVRDGPSTSRAPHSASAATRPARRRRPRRRRRRAGRAGARSARRTAPGLSSVREERKVVTALFADVVSSTALGERLDPEDVKLVVGEAVARIVGDIEALGGHVGTLAGDGVLAFFGAPTTREDDAERALLAALRIVGEMEEYGRDVRRGWGVEGFGVRVGAATGWSCSARSAPEPGSNTPPSATR